MNLVGIIGGTGLGALGTLEGAADTPPETPFGRASSAVCHGSHHGAQVAFIARHGQAGNVPPHRVNYRANLWALRDAGVSRVVAVNAVGGIASAMCPGRIVVPDQLVDYTYGRAHTFFEDDLDKVVHIEFDPPYDESLRTAVIAAARAASVDLETEATYGVTQGPRLETAAEIDRMERDGCDIVGMTAMPEAALARELDLPYVSICVVVNWAAGRGEGDIHGQLARYIDVGMAQVDAVLRGLLAAE